MGKPAKVAIGTLTVVAVLIGGSFLLANAADASVPGDTLYAIDRASEGVEGALVFSPTAKADFEVDLLEERALELSTLEEAVDNLEEQEEAVKTRIRDAEDNENSDSGEIERVRERLELQQELNLQFLHLILGRTHPKTHHLI